MKNPPRPTKRFKVTLHNGQTFTRTADRYIRTDQWVTLARDAEPGDRLIIEFAANAVLSIERIDQ